MTTPHPAELTEAERVRLRALADAATPGPWVAHNAPNGFPAGVTGQDMAVADTFDKPDLPDAKFIAAARTAIPALLDALAAAEQNAAVWAKSTGRIAAEKHMAQLENQRLREGIVALHASIGPYKAAQSAIADLDREHIDVLAVGTILSHLRSDVIAMYDRALLSTSSVRGEGDG